MVLSLKPNKKRIGALAVAFIVLVTALFFRPSKQTDVPHDAERAGETADERLSFLAQFGWKADPEPLEVREIVIPEKFDKVYTRYNALQKKQGMDLQPYAGKTCKQWIYRVLNFPQSESEVHAVILVYEGKIIGGDISSVALNGFMTTFDDKRGSKEEKEEKATDAWKKSESSSGISALPADAWPTD